VSDGKRRSSDLILSRPLAKIGAGLQMRDPGVPWLEKIPVHWELTRLKFVAHVQTGIALGKTFGGAELVEFPYLRVANVQDGYIDLSDVKTMLGDMSVPFPPAAEQKAIVEHIARETAKLDNIRAATERTIALLKERRAALIAAAVTGQIEVGTAA